MRDPQAYQTMVNFLDERYQRLPSDVLGALLGELSLQHDGRPADPAIIEDWERATSHAVSEDRTAIAMTAMRRKAG